MERMKFPSLYTNEIPKQQARQGLLFLVLL